MFVVWSLSLFIYFVLFVQILRPPRSKCTDTRFPYTTPFRSPHQVEDGAFPYRPANGAEPPERGMMVLREQEADAEIGQRRFGCRGGAVQVQAERFPRVGGAGLGGGGGIAVLGRRKARGRHPQRHGGRDPERPGPRPAPAAENG